MAKINNDSLRAPFFPNKTPLSKSRKSQTFKSLSRNDSDRKAELDNLSKEHAKVSINTKIKDFSRIKKAVDNSQDIDRSELLLGLKKKIQNGDYQIDPEKIAEKMILNEF